jgi:hypothetical protein
MANKQDLKEAMTAEQITEHYSLGDIQNHTWHLQVHSGRLSFAQQLRERGSAMD